MYIFFIIFLAMPVYAQEPAVSADAYLDSSVIDTGSSVLLNIEVKADRGVNLEIPDVNIKELSGLTVTDSDFSGPLEANGSIHLSFWYRLMPEKSGDYLIPEITVYYLIGKKRLKINTEKLFLSVNEINKNNKEELRPLKPLKLPEKWDYKPLIVVLVILIVLIIIYFIIKKRKKALIKEVPLLSPREEALEALFELKTDHIAKPGDIRFFCFRISEILRRYLSGEYSLNIMEATSFEIINNGSLKEIFSPELFEKMEYFLNKTDQVKFAKYNISKMEMDDIYSIAFNLVQAGARLEPSSSENETLR